MSRIKDYYEKRAEELGFDIEFTDETANQIMEIDQRKENELTSCN